MVEVNNKERWDDVDSDDESVEREVDMEINSTFDAKVNSVVDLEIDNKERWDDVDLDEDITEEEVDMEIDSIFDVKVNSVIEVEVNNKECEDNVESDDESMHTAKRHDNKYAEYDLNNK